MSSLHASSSEILHLKAVEDLRVLDFKAFEGFVIQNLAKSLKLKPSVFKKKCFTIYYTTEEVSNGGYHYCVLSDDDDRSTQRCSGCFRFLRSSSKLKSMQYRFKPNDDYLPSSILVRHLRAIHEFLTREENLRMDGIFLKIGSREIQQKIRDQMHALKYVDFDELGCSAYDCANVLKQLLLRMPEPLFISNYYPAYERVAKFARDFELEHGIRKRLKLKNSLLPPDSELLLKEQHLIGCLQLIIHLMPERKREIFKQVFDILDNIHKYHNFNRSTPSALGAIFAPLIICPRGLPPDVAFSVSRDMSAIITKMVRIGDDIFGAPPKFRLQVWKYVLKSKDYLNERRPTIAPPNLLY